MSCGASPTGHKKFCRHCGVGLNPEQVVCVRCGGSLPDGTFGSVQWQSLVPIILPLLLILLFFTPQFFVGASKPETTGVFGMRIPAENMDVPIWGWNSWFGIVTLILGCLILAGKVAEYSTPNINKFPQQLYSGLYGIIAFCAITGMIMGISSGAGTWVYAAGILGGQWYSGDKAMQLLVDSGWNVAVIPVTIILVLGVTVFGLFQKVLTPWLFKQKLTMKQIFIGIAIGFVCLILFQMILVFLMIPAKQPVPQVGIEVGNGTGEPANPLPKEPTLEIPIGDKNTFKVRTDRGNQTDSFSVVMTVVIRKADERAFNRRYPLCTKEVIDRATMILNASTTEERKEADHTTIKEKVRHGINEVLGMPWVQRVIFTEVNLK